ncbi:AEL140Cp [Eremothecium gossypii ATCC 10895]|uniref:AEL140Cp n=1 Tax=Eremothecium gossypii (strain ATCC 10895 / CBS 109.51 / FGSC 9923 / NRRL Y-1056) TaxID=284811 RepID=Q758A0_EREGS|nr:AEL140Cp [Eremothecium gossypii ATCC 10895]AAS52545.1 AEL140Cp [Eremothecium gossypii ATCC 10895]
MRSLRFVQLHRHLAVLGRARCRVYSSATAAPLGVDKTSENNLQTETNRLAKTFTKFWDKVDLAREGGHVTVHIDGKPVRTPLGSPLRVDERRGILAHMLREEWAGLTSLAVKPYSLPLTSLVSRCIDLETVSAPGCHPDTVAKVGGDRSAISQGLLRYLDTDTLLCFSPRSEFEGALRKAQDEMYKPIIAGVETLLAEVSGKPVSLRCLDADVHGLRGNVQSEDTRAAAGKYMDNLSVWDFAVFEKVVLTTKSFICGILLLQNKIGKAAPALKLSTEEIARAATLETIYQVERWGEVEDTHDVNHRDIRRNINAAAVVAYRE